MGNSKLSTFDYGTTQYSPVPGPELPVAIYHPADEAKRYPVTLRGVIDTGSVITCMPFSKVADLGPSLIVGDFERFFRHTRVFLKHLGVLRRASATGSAQGLEVNKPQDQMAISSVVGQVCTDRDKSQ